MCIQNKSEKNKKSPQSFLRIFASNGIVHLLPYGHLLHVGFCSHDDGKDGKVDSIVMRFAIHNVTIEGSGLEPLLPAIQDMTLSDIGANHSRTANITSVVVVDTQV